MNSPYRLPAEPPPSNWRDRAACSGSPEPYLFDATIDDDGKERPQARTERHSLALAICSRCPVRDDCLAEGLTEGVEGVRGGVVLRPLAVHRKHDRAPVPINHNTESGWQMHKRRGVPVDPVDSCGCRRAARRASDLRKRRAAG